MIRAPRQPHPIGQWREDGDRLAAQWADLAAERAIDTPTINWSLAQHVVMTIGALAAWGVVWVICAVTP